MSKCSVRVVFFSILSRFAFSCLWNSQHIWLCAYVC